MIQKLYDDWEDSQIVHVQVGHEELNTNWLFQHMVAFNTTTREYFSAGEVENIFICIISILIT